MPRRFSILLAAGALMMLSACATPSGVAGAGFDPATCYDRDFSIYFEGQDATLTPAAREVLDAAGAATRGCVVESVQVIGLADAHEGGQESSRQISVERAEIMAEYLATRLGWPRSRMELLATGERGAVTQEGLERPMRSRARVIAHIVAP